LPGFSLNSAVDALLKKDLIFGSDPDADRFGLLIRVPAEEVHNNPEIAEAMGIVIVLTPEEQVRYGFGAFRVVSPNEWGALITYYDLMRMKKSGKLNTEEARAKLHIIRSHVTSDIFTAICKKFNIPVMSGDILPVGVDQVAERIKKVKASGGEAVSGIEESGTYATGNHILDKDGFLAGMRLAEISCSVLSHGKKSTDQDSW